MLNKLSFGVIYISKHTTFAISSQSRSSGNIDNIKGNSTIGSNNSSRTKSTVIISIRSNISNGIIGFFEEGQRGVAKKGNIFRDNLVLRGTFNGISGRPLLLSAAATQVTTVNSACITATISIDSSTYHHQQQQSAATQVMALP
ncbi:hypothetical protein DPMN_173324 [Dreissena polymorpha]|uniref:Uncharacterized protein n=1 Tax=Dreissena polymorpha TaxID=45954 RepID=A0A9D4IHG8_DREPO|nr:hypothetical protein DPMN_173324 [Dreissena polymorpha]